MTRRLADAEMFGNPDLKEKARRDPTESDPQTKLSRRMKLLAGMIFANLGGTATVEESGPGKLNVYLPDGNTWKLNVKDDRVTISGDPNSPNYGDFLGKLGKTSILDIAENAANIIHEAMDRNPPEPPAYFEGAYHPDVQQPEQGPDLVMPPGAEPPMEPMGAPEDLSGMTPDMGMPPEMGGMPGGDMGMGGVPPAPMPGPAAPAPSPFPGAVPPQQPMAPPPFPPTASRRRIAGRLDEIAAQLEEAGHRKLAARIDRVANTLEQDIPQERTAAKGKAVNPWAICTDSVGRDDKDKYESCVQGVKKKHKIKSSSRISTLAKKVKVGDFIKDQGEVTKKYRESTGEQVFTVKDSTKTPSTWTIRYDSNEEVELDSKK